MRRVITSTVVIMLPDSAAAIVAFALVAVHAGAYIDFLRAIAYIFHVALPSPKNGHRVQIGAHFNEALAVIKGNPRKRVA